VGDNYDGVNAMFNHMFGLKGYDAIFCAQGASFSVPEHVPEQKNRADAYLDVVRQAGAEFANGTIQAETLAILAEPLFPRELYEKQADDSWGNQER
jgi:hypothetical protein